MLTFKVKLNSIDRVKDFVNIMSKQPFDVDIVSDRYVINAKSIMGIFSLNLIEPKEIRAFVDNDDVAETFKNAISDFIVE